MLLYLSIYSPNNFQDWFFVHLQVCASFIHKNSRIAYTPWQTEGRGNVMRLVHQVQCTPILWLFNIIIARVSAPTSFSVFFISLGLRLNRWVLIWGMFLHAIYWSRVFFSWLRFLVLFFYARGKPSLAPIFFWPMALPPFNLPLGGPLSSFLRVAIL